MSAQCGATKDTGMGPNRYQRQCKKPAWRGTPYCYQHAIAFGFAVVATRPDLGSTLGAALSERLWRRLGGRAE